MRVYCEEQQQTAAEIIRGRTMGSSNEQMIRRTCLSEWPDDFKMRDYCEVEQLKALIKLR
jgi:hypothetical protein